jgi:hypothetical protein
MRNLFTLVLLSVFSIVLNAQTVPNHSYETWEDFGAYENPVSWNTPNPFTSLASVVVVTKSDDAVSGNFSAKLETKILFAGFSAPGLLTLADFFADILTGDFSITGGIPLQDKPVKIKGYYKYSSVIEDSAFVQAYNFKYTGDQQRDTIGMAVWYGQAAETWTYFEAPFTYESNEIPDTLNIIIMSTGSSVFTPGSIMHVDSLSLELETGVNLPLLPETGFRHFPNPAKDIINLQSPVQLQNAEVTIISADGRTLFTDIWNGRQKSIAISNLNSGLYTYRVIQNERILHSATFLVK